MKDFYETWKFKHPGVNDFYSAFEKHTGDDLKTFFENVFDKTSFIDFGIEKHKDNFLVENKGTFNTPIEVAYYDKNGNEISYIDVLEPAEAPSTGPGLYFMDTSSAAAECNTIQAAAGYTVHVFPTGQGNIIGNPIMPVIKVTGNPRTVRTMGEHIDVDVSGVVRREMTISEAGDALMELVLLTANGRLTAAEALGHKEFVMTKLYRSA